jgi:hypothetical protein
MDAFYQRFFDVSATLWVVELVQGYQVPQLVK